VPQDFQHLGGAGSAAGNKRCIGRMQPVPAEIARHSRVIGSIKGHLKRLAR
jgi:hypothetical protein